MEAKENRPDACAASGTAQSIYKDFSTDAPDIQEELTGPVLPDECAVDIVSFCSEQTIAYDDLLEYATLFYLQDKDPEDPPFRDTLKFELLTLTNSCIDAYNFGKRDPNAGPGAKLKDAYPDKKEGAERYKRLSGLHTLQIAVILYKLHHAVGILWNNSHDDGNFDIGIYQYSGDNEGCYDVGEQNLKSLIRGYCKTGTIKDVNETIEALRAICPRVERCRNRDLVAVNNGIYDYGNKILMAFDPAFVFTSKKHVDFVDRARNPVIHNDEDGTDWDVVSWMNELSDDPDVVSLLWQIIGATVRPYVSWNKSAWLYSPSGNNGKGTLCTLLRNLCGAGDWTSIPLKNFGKDFMLTSLMHASVIITDENDTGTFVDDAASLKRCSRTAPTSASTTTATSRSPAECPSLSTRRRSIGRKSGSPRTSARVPSGRTAWTTPRPRAIGSRASSIAVSAGAPCRACQVRARPGGRITTTIVPPSAGRSATCTRPASGT